MGSIAHPTVETGHPSGCPFLFGGIKLPQWPAFATSTAPHPRTEQGAEYLDQAGGKEGGRTFNNRALVSETLGWEFPAWHRMHDKSFPRVTIADHGYHQVKDSD